MTMVGTATRHMTVQARSVHFFAGPCSCRPVLYRSEGVGMSEKRDAKETARVEAFSDGVFAIAITLLILEIKVPHLPSGAGSRELLHALLAEWPSLLAFVLSFTAVLVMWINHHGLFNLIQ